VRDRLAASGIPSFAKTTGGKGLHVTVPLTPAPSWAEVKAFAKALADTMAEEAPDRFTAKAAKSGRKGRIFIDYLRNERGATAVAAYSPRAREGATVATPIAWEEVTPALNPQAFTVRTVPARVRAEQDPWAEFDRVQASLPRQ
jgi:bifunctional non-homologous end joining protein LigD